MRQESQTERDETEFTDLESAKMLCMSEARSSCVRMLTFWDKAFLSASQLSFL